MHAGLQRPQPQRGGVPGDDLGGVGQRAQPGGANPGFVEQPGGGAAVGAVVVAVGGQQIGGGGHAGRRTPPRVAQHPGGLGGDVVPGGSAGGRGQSVEQSRGSGVRGGPVYRGAGRELAGVAAEQPPAVPVQRPQQPPAGGDRPDRAGGPGQGQCPEQRGGVDNVGGGPVHQIAVPDPAGHGSRPVTRRCALAASWDTRASASS
jgi:hypothetical protein